jgi:flavin-dependent dehydrogenase
MGSLRNTYRHIVVNRQPAALGYFAVGEAAVHTNPLYGRGCSLGVLHAQILAEVLHRETEPAARAMAFHHQTQTQLRPFYDLAVRRDHASQRRARQAMAGPSTPNWQQRLGRSLLQHGLAPAIRGDLDVRRAFVRDFHMLELPGVALRRPSIALRILRFRLRGAKRNALLYAPPAGPGREDIRRLLGLSPP